MIDPLTCQLSFSLISKYKLLADLERDQTRRESLVPYNCEAFSSQEGREEGRGAVNDPMILQNISFRLPLYLSLLSAKNMAGMSLLLFFLSLSALCLL